MYARPGVVDLADVGWEAAFVFFAKVRIVDLLSVFLVPNAPLNRLARGLEYIGGQNQPPKTLHRQSG